MFTKFLSSIGIPSPWFLLALVAIVGVLSGAAYNLGDTNGFNRAEAARAGAQDAAIAALNEQLATVRAEAVAEAAKRGEAVAAADTSKAGLNKALKELRDEKNKPADSCVSPAWRMRVNTAVAAANAPAEASAGSVPIRVPAAPPTGVGLRAVGGGNALGSGGMPAAARDLPEAGEVK